MFDFIIKWRVCREAWCMVDFQQIWLALLVQEDIKAKYLKAHQIFDVCRLARPVAVRQLGLSRNQSLDNQILYFAHHFGDVVLLSAQPFEYFPERPLVPCIVVYAGCHAKISLSLVDGIVCEMHTEVVEFDLICFGRKRLVLFGCKPHDSVLV